ncbi:ArdC-like ssDNA-binding domain-containing protein [Candidatus Riflebacteria bacterium]
MRRNIISHNIYEEITEKIISKMEKGIIPWQKPWKERQ